MSFPLDPSGTASSVPTVLGEVFVCPRVAITYAHAHDLDPYAETTRYLIHGILHLLGYDDLTPREKQVMRRKENGCLALLEKEGKLLNKS